jgi:hypothetical protein
VNWSPKSGRHEDWQFEFMDVNTESKTRPEVRHRAAGAAVRQVLDGGRSVP